MQQADITSITRELAGLVAERYVFPGLGGRDQPAPGQPGDAASGYAASPG